MLTHSEGTHENTTAHLNFHRYFVAIYKRVKAEEKILPRLGLLTGITMQPDD